MGKPKSLKPAGKSTSTSSTRAAPAASSDQIGTDHMDQVRELLFGEQVRHIQDRFEQIEQRLSEQLSQLAERFDHQLENAVRQQDTQNGQLESQLKQLSQDQENRISALEDDLRSALGTLGSEMQTLLQAVQQRHQQEQAALDQSKVNREQLADLLTGLADTLRLAPADKR